MKQVTLVMLYGPKPSYLPELILDCQRQIANILGSCFQPYSISQVHATFIGLERVPRSAMINLNMTKYRGRSATMDFSGLLNFMRTGGYFPLQVQIGGFQDRDYPFESRGQKPYERSFSIQGEEAATAIILGWPIRGKPLRHLQSDIVKLVQENRIYTNQLDQARQAVQAFNLLHHYHRELTDVDNDFYFRIGTIHQSSVDYSLRQSVVTTLRQYLSQLQPMIVEVTLSDIYVVSYENESLPVDSSEAWSISDPTVTPEFIQELYG